MPRYYKNYPRPQLVRKEDSWENLNGSWDFVFDDSGVGEFQSWYNGFTASHAIQVPFTYETKSSGICDTSVHTCVWYQRKVTIDAEKLANGALLLHFEGSDYRTTVWLNGQKLDRHCGGYARFSIDATANVKSGENLLVVRVEDSLDEQQVRGKQRWKNQSYGCWYIQTTGIWKTVWMEYVPNSYITKIKMTPDLENGMLEVELETNRASLNATVDITVKYGSVEVRHAKYSLKGDRLSERISVYCKEVSEWGIQRWSPKSPNLYDIEITLQNEQHSDTVWSYFGMRSIRIENQNILLNGAPLYQRLILDQGYWEDSHLTPPNEAALVEDIDKIMALGYNGLRKHQKTEDERFLYWCDVKGLLVWCEMPSAYQYGDHVVQQFISEWLDVVRQNYNHPCIITWTPINESWGVPDIKNNVRQQRFTEAIYYATKALDDMRPVIVNDGWEHTISDIITLHDYEELGEVFWNRYSNNFQKIMENEVFHCKDHSAFANGYVYSGQPVIISEYGGIAYSNDDSGWGYGNKVNTEEAFMERFASITTAVQRLDFCCGFCYTQVTDVQQEVNGLMDIRRNYKVDVRKVYSINMQRT